MSKDEDRQPQNTIEERKGMMRRFREWFCRKFLGRTPMLWEDFGHGVKRRGYYVLDSEGKPTPVFRSHGQTYI